MNLLKRLLSNSSRCYSTKKSIKQIEEEIRQIPILDYTSDSKDRNRVFVWGNVKHGALGVKYTKQKNLIGTIRFPKRLGFAERHEIDCVACGFGFTIFSVNNDVEGHRIYGTGLNTDSQLGSHRNPQGKPLDVIFFPQPISIPFKTPNDVKVLKVAAGRAHVAVLTLDGLYLFGNNSYGQCGRQIVENEDYAESQHVNFVERLGDGRIVDVVCGQDHTIAINDNGELYSCGWGADGQTGVGHFNSTSEFSRINGDVKGECIVKVASRSDFVMALNDRGDVFGWGNTEYAQMTTKTNEQQVCNPTYMEVLRGLGKVVDVAAGGSSCLAVNENNDVFSWGFGILGVGPEVQQSSEPLHIPPTLFGRNDFNPESRVVKIESGLAHSVAITNTGDLYAWGRNREGCLGLGDLKDQFFPLKVALGGQAKSVSCGVDHSAVVCQSFLADSNKDV